LSSVKYIYTNSIIIARKCGGGEEQWFPLVEGLLDPGTSSFNVPAISEVGTNGFILILQMKELRQRKETICLEQEFKFTSA
jgi:hypothetical protein